jgi:MFS family permease
MIRILLQTMANKPWLRLLALAFLISSIGNGITWIVVFGELIRLSAPVASLALAYVLSTVPGLLGSIAGERFCQRLSPFTILILGEGLGLIGLAVPFYAVAIDSIPLLLMAQAIGAFTTGMTFPALSQLFKTGLSEEELPVATTLESLIFAGNVLCGIGLGLVLRGYMSATHLLLIDLLSFAAALILLGRAKRRVGAPFVEHVRSLSSLRWQTLTHSQRRAMLLLPLLAAAGAPAMALLPGLAPGALSSGSPEQTTALALLFTRSLGQLVGPLLLNPARFEKNSSSNGLQIGCLAIFLLCYGLIPFAPWPAVALALVFVAHIFSNVVFSLAVYALLRNFERQQVPAAIARSYRRQMAVSAIVSLGAGYCAEAIGAAGSHYLFSGTGFILSVALLAIGKASIKPERA